VSEKIYVRFKLRVKWRQQWTHTDQSKILPVTHS